jgi:hypothetical protein
VCGEQCKEDKTRWEGVTVAATATAATTAAAAAAAAAATAATAVVVVDGPRPCDKEVEFAG